MLGLVHALARLDRPWGTFGHPAEHFTSTFINPNHLAGFLGLCSIIALGLTMTARDNWRWAHLGNAVLMGGAVILSLSRGGILAYVGALGFLGLLVWLGRSERLSRLLWLQLAFAGALLVAGYLAYTQIVHELWTLGNDRAFDKAQIWRPVPEMVADFPVLGAGRGAFTAVYPRYESEGMPATFTHLENEWLQALVDFGPVPALVLLAGLGLAFVLILRRGQREPLAHAVAAALLFLAIHNLGDFNLTLTALVMPAVMVAALFARGAGDAPYTGIRALLGGGTDLSPRAGWALSTGLAVVVLACAWPAMTYGLDRDTERLRSTLASRGTPAPTREQVAAVVTRRHPADYLLPLLVAEHELKHSDGARRALHWINRGMYLAPNYGPAHILAGRALLELGARDQALSEYRLACKTEPNQCRQTAAEVWALTSSPDAVASLGRSTPQARLAVADFLLSKKAAEHALTLATEKRQQTSPPDQDPGSSAATNEVEAPLAERAATALLALERYDEAIQQTKKIQDRWPQRHTAYATEARAHTALHHLDDAVSALERGIERADQSASLLDQLAGVHLQKGDVEQARETAKRILARSGDSSRTAKAYWLLGRAYRREGRHASALREMERARDFHPENLGYRLGIAHLRETLGDLRGSRAELQRARAAVGSSTAIDQAIERVEKAAAEKEERLRWENLVGGKE